MLGSVLSSRSPALLVWQTIFSTFGAALCADGLLFHFLRVTILEEAEIWLGSVQKNPR